MELRALATNIPPLVSIPQEDFCQQKVPQLDRLVSLVP